MLRLVHGSDQGKTVGQLQRCFETLGQSLFQAGLDLESIHHHVDPVLSFLVERGDVVNVIYGAIHPQPNEPLAAHGLDDLEVFSLAVTNHRGQDHQAAAFRHGQNLVYHLADGLRFKGLTVVGTARLPRPGKQQAQVVIDLGDGADRRAGVARCALLVDGDSRREALDEVDVGFVHLA